MCSGLSVLHFSANIPQRYATLKWLDCKDQAEARVNESVSTTFQGLEAKASNLARRKKKYEENNKN